MRSRVLAQVMTSKKRRDLQLSIPLYQNSNQHITRFSYRLRFELLLLRSLVTTYKYGQLGPATTLIQRVWTSVVYLVLLQALFCPLPFPTLSQAHRISPLPLACAESNGTHHITNKTGWTHGIIAPTP